MGSSPDKTLKGKGGLVGVRLKGEGAGEGKGAGEGEEVEKGEAVETQLKLKAGQQ